MLNVRSIGAVLAALLLITAVHAQDAQRNIPPLIATSDITDWTLAAHGREAALQSLGMKDAIFLVTGGAFSTDSIDPAARAQQAVALLDAAGIDIVNLSHSDLTGDATALIAAVTSARSKIISANISLPQGTPWKSHVIVERGGKPTAIRARRLRRLWRR